MRGLGEVEYGGGGGTFTTLFKLGSVTGMPFGVLLLLLVPIILPIMSSITDSVFPLTFTACAVSACAWVSPVRVREDEMKATAFDDDGDDFAPGTVEVDGDDRFT